MLKVIERLRTTYELQQLITAGGPALADPKLKEELNKPAGTGGGVAANITATDADAWKVWLANGAITDDTLRTKKQQALKALNILAQDKEQAVNEVQAAFAALNGLTGFTALNHDDLRAEIKKAVNIGGANATITDTANGEND